MQNEALNHVLKAMWLIKEKFEKSRVDDTVTMEDWERNLWNEMLPVVQEYYYNRSNTWDMQSKMMTDKMIKKLHEDIF